jgi:glycosyltransferase involved in cell wall biosynthesis
VPEKGVDLAIEAISRLPDLQLVVVGDGAGRVALEHQAARVAAGRVVFTGSLADSAPVLGAADVVVFPSRGGDSLPAVLIEAGLAEVPVVAADLAGITEIVIDGVTGRLVPAGSPDAIAAAIEPVLSSVSYAQALGQKARDHCLHHFAMGVIAPLWDDLLVEVSPATGEST